MQGFAILAAISLLSTYILLVYPCVGGGSPSAQVSCPLLTCAPSLRTREAGWPQCSRCR